MNRVNGFLVVLEEDISAERAAELQHLFMNIRGVVSVAVIESDPSTQIAEQRARHKLAMKLLDALKF